MRIQAQVLFLFIVLHFCVGAPSIAAGNGSSGVGNSFPITDGIDAQVAKDEPLVMNEKGDLISDGKTGEPLFALDSIDMPVSSPNLVSAQLGAVNGFESIPSVGPVSREPRGKSDHYWLICRPSKRCLRLTPLSLTNPKVEAMLGALRATRAGP